MDKDPEYFPKIIKRLDPKIKDVMYTLLESGFMAVKMFLIFYTYLENGLENFSIPKKFDTVVYSKEIIECNPEMVVFMCVMYTSWTKSIVDFGHSLQNL